MNNDIFIVLGVIVAGLSFPSMLSAYSSGRPPRTALILFVAGAGLISWAIYQQPNTYSIDSIPEVFVRVIAGFIR